MVSIYSPIDVSKVRHTGHCGSSQTSIVTGAPGFNVRPEPAAGLIVAVTASPFAKPSSAVNDSVALVDELIMEKTTPVTTTRATIPITSQRVKWSPPLAAFACLDIYISSFVIAIFSTENNP